MSNSPHTCVGNKESKLKYNKYDTISKTIKGNHEGIIEGTKMNEFKLVVFLMFTRTDVKFLHVYKNKL